MTSRRVLVVDDSDLMLDVVRSALEQDGFSVTTARSMSELESCDVRSYELVLVDVQMPELFGDDLVAMLRQARCVDSRIVLLSNLPSDELAHRAEAAGADGFVCKREGMDALVKYVRGVVR